MRGTIMGNLVNVKENTKKYFQLYWYGFTFTLLTIYVLLNWCCVTEFVFFSKFNGTNLLFIVWLVLLILPSIGRFEGFGVKMRSPFESLEKKADELAAQSRRVVSTDDLENEFVSLVERIR
jgi:hypothetical protein